MNTEDIEVFIGIDVGKSEHWATALSREGRKVFDKALPNDEGRLRALYKKLADHGHLLVVVDQPATIGALAVAVAQDMGITVGYLPGLSMRRIADLTPGSAKTDAKDAAVIAGAARSMPHTLRAINASDEDAAALSMLTGFDLDLARQVNQSANRIRGLYTQIHPTLEQVLGPWLEHDAVLEVIAAWPTPADLKRAGKARIDARLKKHGCRRHATWAGQIVSALEHQSVVVAGTDAAAVVLPHLARQLISLHAQRADVAAQVGNKRLKRAMFLSAFASLRSDPVSRAYYQRKRDQGKRHNQAVLALAHRRILTLHAMIRDGALYDPQPATKLPAAA